MEKQHKKSATAIEKYDKKKNKSTKTALEGSHPKIKKKTLWSIILNF